MNDPRPQPFYITLLRHGESVGNAESRSQGQADFPLNDTGRAQARALAERWKAEGTRFDFVIASPLVRAKETAEIVASVMNLKRIVDRPLRKYERARNLKRLQGIEGESGWVDLTSVVDPHRKRREARV